MASHDTLFSPPELNQAIDPHVLAVDPATSLVEVLAQMSCAQGSRCSLPNESQVKEATDEDPTQFQCLLPHSSSCVLILENTQLVGIFTERDIIQLTATGVDFSTVRIGQVMIQPVITLLQAELQDVFAALFLFRRYRIRHLPVLDSQGQVMGMITPSSIRRVLRPTNLLRLRRVSEVMTTDVIQASLTTSVLQLAQLMFEHHISCVVIMESRDTGSYPVGIVTEHDIVQFQALQLSLARTKAEAVMSTPLFLLVPTDSLWAAHQEMQRRHVRRLVVSWDWGRGVGIITQTSLLRVFDPMEMHAVIATLQQTVQRLEVEHQIMQQRNLELERQLHEYFAGLQP